ncbi:MAG: hypothetical protein U9O59_07385 [Actinomycetota bacterium]|nr:hypothetical protein [Actinomycetota bacterium]
MEKQSISKKSNNYFKFIFAFIDFSKIRKSIKWIVTAIILITFIFIISISFSCSFNKQTKLYRTSEDAGISDYKEEVNTAENNKEKNIETEGEEPILENDSSENKQIDVEISDSLDVLIFDGEIELKIVGDRIVVTIYSNVPDGGIFDILILDKEVKGQTDIATIKDGEIEKDFLIPEDWSSGEIAVLASFRFNVDSQPQPDHIIGIYGSKGEKMQGELTEDTSEGGKMGILEDYINYVKDKDIGYEIVHVIQVI